MPARPAAQPPKPLVPSAPAKRELTLQWERFSPIVKQFPPVFKEHWREIALDQDQIPLEPNYDLYLNADLVGVLQVLTVRFGVLLVGYVFTMVGPALHYNSTIMAEVDMYWLDPAFRSGWTGVKMFTEVIRKMREVGAKKLFISEKIHFHNENDRRVGLLLKRLGFAPVEIKHAMTLEPYHDGSTGTD